MPELTTVQRLAYMAWDAVFLCFNVRDKASMLTILSWVSIEPIVGVIRGLIKQWHHALKDDFTKTQGFQPLLHLVGMKKDLRDHCAVIDHRMGSFVPPGLLSFPTCCVCPSEV